MAELPALPRRSNGIVEWPKVPGFLKWLKAEGPGLSNPELIAAMKHKYGVDMTIGACRSLRQTHRVPQTPETRRRAYDNRDTTMPVKDPIQQMDEKLLRDQVKRLTTVSTFWELVGDKVIRAAQALPPLLPIRPPKISMRRGLTEEEAVLVITDVQAGLTTSARESGGLGEFNSAILLQEIAYLQESLDAIQRYHPNVRRLSVVFNGDIVEGQTIFDGQAREVDMDLIKQILFCVEHFGALLVHLAGRYERVTCTGVVGNHGRLGRKGELSPMTNFDYLVYQWLRERTRPTANIVWQIPETWWTVLSVLGWRFLCVHGDDTGSGTWGIPFYGMARHKHRYRELLKVSGHLNEELPRDFEYMILGHHSQAAQFQNVISGGSWPGGTEFSLKRLQASDIPTAPFFGVSQRHGVTWRRDIQLRPIHAPSMGTTVRRRITA